jgi:hypothetical protein
MNIFKVFLIFLVLFSSLSIQAVNPLTTNTQININQKDNTYVIITNIPEDDPYYSGIPILEEYRAATIINFINNVNETLPTLRSIKPDYVAVVVKPQNIDVDFVASAYTAFMHIDEDELIDAGIGFLTAATPSDLTNLIKNTIKAESQAIPKKYASVINPNTTVVGVNQRSKVYSDFFSEAGWDTEVINVAGKNPDIYKKLSNSSLITLDMHGTPTSVEYLPSFTIKKGPSNFLFPAVAIASPCYTASTYKVITEGTGKIDYINPSDSFSLSFINRGAVGYVGHLRVYGANWYILEPVLHGMTCLNMSQGESLTHAINKGISTYANAQNHNFGDEKSWIDDAKTNYFGYLLYGDPAYKLNKDNSIPPIISPSSELLSDKMILNVKFNRNVTLFTPGHIEQVEWAGLAEAHSPMKIRVLLPNDLIVKDIKLLDFTDPTNKITLSFIGWIEERWLDEKFLYLYLNFGFPDLGYIHNGTLINLEISVNEPVTGRIKVIVRDSSGFVIPGANVSSTSQPSGQPGLIRISSSAGSATFSNAMPGSYTLKASKPGYYPSSGMGSVVYKGTTEITLMLQPIPVTGNLRVTVKDSSGAIVSGAHISSTSQPSGQTTLSGASLADGRLTFGNLLPGNYSVEVSKSGYATITGRASVKAGDTSELTITLQTQSSGGIPGFPFASLIVGMILWLVWVWGKNFCPKPKILSVSRKACLLH